MNLRTYIVRTMHTGHYAGRFIGAVHIEAPSELEAARTRFAQLLDCAKSETTALLVVERRCGAEPHLFKVESVPARLEVVA